MRALLVSVLLLGACGPASRYRRFPVPGEGQSTFWIEIDHELAYCTRDRRGPVCTFVRTERQPVEIDPPAPPPPAVQKPAPAAPGDAPAYPIPPSYVPK